MYSSTNACRFFLFGLTQKGKVTCEKSGQDYGNYCRRSSKFSSDGVHTYGKGIL